MSRGTKPGFPHYDSHRDSHNLLFPTFIVKQLLSCVPYLHHGRYFSALLSLSHKHMLNLASVAIFLTIKMFGEKKKKKPNKKENPEL